MLLTIEMSQVRYTPKVATKKTAALWNIERELSSAVIFIASAFVLPRPSSSLNLVAIRSE